MPVEEALTSASYWLPNDIFSDLTLTYGRDWAHHVPEDLKTSIVFAFKHRDCNLFVSSSRIGVELGTYETDPLTGQPFYCNEMQKLRETVIRAKNRWELEGTLCYGYSSYVQARHLAPSIMYTASALPPCTVSTRNVAGSMNVMNPIFGALNSSYNQYLSADRRCEQEAPIEWYGFGQGKILPYGMVAQSDRREEAPTHPSGQSVSPNGTLLSSTGSGPGTSCPSTDGSQYAAF